MRHVLMIGTLLFAVSAVACSSNRALRTDSSSSAIRAAEEVGAAEVPSASLHLQLAKEEMASAIVLSKNGEKDKAESMLRRAEVDAELAVLLSREEAEKLEAAEAMERVRKVQNDNR